MLISLSCWKGILPIALTSPQFCWEDWESWGVELVSGRQGSASGEELSGILSPCSPLQEGVLPGRGLELPSLGVCKPRMLGRSREQTSRLMARSPGFEVRLIPLTVIQCSNVLNTYIWTPTRPSQPQCNVLDFASKKVLPS